VTRFRASLGVSAACAFVTGSFLAAADTPGDRYWPQWRGPASNGVSTTAQPPTEWSETKNIRWKIEIPGRGAGTPIVWGDRIYLSTAVPADPGAAATGLHKFVVMAINRKDGKVAWQQTAREEAPHERTHQEFGRWPRRRSSPTGSP